MNSNYYHIPQSHHNVDLKNNYAPIPKQLRDSLSTKDVHPLAEYLDERPWYDNVIYTERTARELQQARKKYTKPISRDTVRLNGENSHFENNILIGVDPLVTEETKVGKEEFTARIKDIGNEAVRQRHETFIPHHVEEKLVTEHFETLEIKGVGIKRGGARFITRNSNESFRRVNSDDTYTDQVYIQSLESRLIAVMRFVSQNETYKPWSRNWKALDSAMRKANFSFSRLNQNDKDVAYTVDKGRETKFRIRGSDGKYLPINVYQYVMLHEAAHCANFNNWGHGTEFQDLLSLLCLASFELGFIRISAIHNDLYTTNGQPVLCRGDIKSEILRGIELVQSKKMNQHYENMRRYVSKQ